MKLTRNLSASLLILVLGLTQSAFAGNHAAALKAAVADRSEEDRSRDAARNPEETLGFFLIKPGMVVAEGLPGSGWYTNILANYLGPKGTLYGINYADRMWPLFSWAKEDFIKARIASTEKFPELVASLTDNGVKARGFTFESVPKEVVGTVDRVLLIRALHNLNRFEAEEGTRTAALKSIYAMLKDDGLVGVVQHRAPESASDKSTMGQRGYLKQSYVIRMFEEAGFELFASTEVNANNKDQPGDKSIVWRLPPSLRGSENDEEKRAAMEAIGESDRMTLLFSKREFDEKKYSEEKLRERMLKQKGKSVKGEPGKSNAAEK